MSLRSGQLASNVHGQRARLAAFHEAVKEFAAGCVKPDSTVRDIWIPLFGHELFHVDERLVQALHGVDSPPDAPRASSDESTDDRRRRGLRDLLNASWAEIGRYRSYREGLSSLATHQVVKGSEFEHVMVIMDDQEAGAFLCSYDKLFGAVSLSATDRSNVAENKETGIIDRTLRLLYVTCSRARETLALALWSTNPEAALGAIKAAGWPSDSEITRVPGFEIDCKLRGQRDIGDDGIPGFRPRDLMPRLSLGPSWGSAAPGAPERLPTLRCTSAASPATTLCPRRRWVPRGRCPGNPTAQSPLPPAQWRRPRCRPTSRGRTVWA